MEGKMDESKEAAVCKTPWERAPLTLYEGLSKHHATALMLLRTEVIGLNAWLAKIGVPDVWPACDCGWQAQTVKHVLYFCPKYRRQREGLLIELGTEDLCEALSHVRSAQLAARWIVQQGVLAQFRAAFEDEQETLERFEPFRPLE